SAARHRAAHVGVAAGISDRRWRLVDSRRATRSEHGRAPALSQHGIRRNASLAGVLSRKGKRATDDSNAARAGGVERELAAADDRQALTSRQRGDGCTACINAPGCSNETFHCISTPADGRKKDASRT